MRLALATLIITALMANPVVAQNSDNQELQNLVDQLKQITSKARQQRAADRWLLNDLEDLVARFDWPWRDELLIEDFSDGNYDQDPTWRVTSGQFWVDGRLGLRSRTQSQEPPARDEAPKREEKQDLGSAILGAIIQEAFKDNRREPEPSREPEQQYRRDEPAQILLSLAIPKVYEAKFEFSVHNRPSEQGQVELGILQDDEGTYGYQISLVTGQRPFIELATLRGGRVQVIDSADIDSISDGDSHTLEWRRDPNGYIEVLMDESPILKTRDNSFRNPFRWLSIANKSGDLAVSSVSMHGRK